MTMNETSESFAPDPIELPSVQPSRLKFDGPKWPLFKAMGEARKHYKSLVTNAKMQFGEGPKARKHDYATLDAVIEALEPGWEAAGINVIQPHDGDVLWTIVSIGESSMSIEQPLSQWASAQDLGGLLTYFRRYALKGVFCVADGEDDGATAPGGQGLPLGRKEPTTAKPTGPGIPEALAAEVYEAAKKNELPKTEFLALANKQAGKPWVQYDEADARKLLGVLRGGS